MATTWDDLKNKPFGEEVVYLLQPTKYTGSSLKLDSSIVAEEVYILTVNAMEYIGTAYYEGEPIYDNVCRLDNANGNSCKIQGNRFTQLRCEVGDTVSVRLAEPLHKLMDEQYIPETIQRTSSVLTQANQNSLDNSYSPTVDSDLVTKGYVDLLASSELEALALVTEMGFVEPAVNNEFIFTDENGAIYTI